MKIKLKKAARLIKNKKGFTLVEAIAVVAIIGVLSVVIGSLISSGTRSYLRQREIAAAKEISVIIAKEIERNIYMARTVFLAGSDSDGNSTLPTATFSEGITNYTVSNPPFQSVDPTMAYSANGEFMYGIDEPYSYFAEDDDERNAFYGDYEVEIYYNAVKDGNNNYTAVLIYVDVYKSDVIKYQSTGRLVKFREAGISSESIVYSYTASTAAGCLLNVSPDGENSYNAEYANVVNMTSKYTYLYFTK